MGNNIRTEILVLAAIIACGIGAIAFAMWIQKPEPKAAQQFGPETGPPEDAPTLDYDAMVGLDPQTQQTNKERARNHNLEERVQTLEMIVQILISEVRGKGSAGQLGDFQPPPEMEQDE